MYREKREEGEEGEARCGDGEEKGRRPEACE